MAEPIMRDTNTKQLFAYVSDDRIDFLSCGSSASGDTFTFYPHAIKPGESIMVNLREAMEAVPDTRNKTVQLRILVSGPTTLVPIADFQEEHVDDLFLYNFPDKRGCRVFYDTLPSIDAMLLFSMPDALYRIIRSIAPQSYYVSASTPLLKHFSEKTAAGAGKRIFAYFENRYTDISVFESSRLLLSNKFEVPAAEDAAYYILSCMGRTGTDNENDAVFLSGSAEYIETLKTLLERYVKNVFRIFPQAEFHRHPVTANKEIPYPLVLDALNSKAISRLHP